MINVGSSISGYMHVFMRKMNLYTVIIRYDQPDKANNDYDCENCLISTFTCTFIKGLSKS